MKLQMGMGCLALAALFLFSFSAHAEESSHRLISKDPKITLKNLKALHDEIIRYEEQLEYLQGKRVRARYNEKERSKFILNITSVLESLKKDYVALQREVQKLDVEALTGLDGSEELSRYEKKIATAAEAPWYKTFIDTIKQWDKNLSAEERRQRAYWLKDKILSTPDQLLQKELRSNGDHREPDEENKETLSPNPTQAAATPPPLPDLPPLTDAPPTTHKPVPEADITISKTSGAKTTETAPKNAESPSVDAHRQASLKNYLERASGVILTPEIERGLKEKIIPELLRDLAESNENDAATAFAKVGELQEIFRGQEAVEPLRYFALQSGHELQKPITTNPYLNGKFSQGSISLGDLRLCEEKVFVSPSGNSLGGPCSKRKGASWKRDYMVSISKAYNKLSDLKDRQMFWSALYSCLAHKETGTAWEKGAEKKVVKKPLDIFKGYKAHYAAQDPNDPATWTSLYGNGDDGTMQFSACQAESNALGYVDLKSKTFETKSKLERKLLTGIGCHPRGGNVYPCITVWNERQSSHPNLQVPERTHKFRIKLANGDYKTIETPGYDLAKLRDLIVSKDQVFNRFCGMLKLFSTLELQYRLNVKENGKACASPFNKFDNHYGSLMCHSSGMTRCMAKFVDYKTNTVKTTFLQNVHAYYTKNISTDGFSTQTPAKTVEPVVHKEKSWLPF